jgi:hypothetical protein
MSSSQLVQFEVQYMHTVLLLFKITCDVYSSVRLPHHRLVVCHLDRIFNSLSSVHLSVQGIENAYVCDFMERRSVRQNRHNTRHIMGCTVHTEMLPDTVLPIFL